MGLLSVLFGGGRKSPRDSDKERYRRRDETDHQERENHQRWLDERSKDP